jgi:hypothetical protein
MGAVESGRGGSSGEFSLAGLKKTTYGTFAATEPVPVKAA